MAETASNIDELKVHLDTLFNFASQVSYTQNHLLPVIQAGKSLIGIRPENPPKNLLKWLEGYVKEFSLKKDEAFGENELESPEVIDISRLGELINSNKKPEALKYLYYLKKVASAEYIAEYLIELASVKSPFQLLFCWYVYKSIRNMKNENQLSLLDLGVSCLLDVNRDENANHFELICYKQQILNTKMLRSNSIFPSLKVLVNSAKLEISEDCHTLISLKLVELIHNEGELGVWIFLSSLPMEALNYELILLLDAVRSAIRYSSTENDWFMEKIINSQVKTEC
ncbi:MAG: hypothetical protein QF380_02845 [Candidatus Marinimicrobia bacterium]|nr:hypothetical protein [Candidatus Neomarinimicrobiota bacterium]